MRLVSTALLLLSLACPARAESAPWQPLDEAAANFKLISFKDIPQTRYRLQAGVLEAEVQRSSAVWLLPLEKPRRVSRVSFLWQMEGSLPPQTAAQEASKAGDDAPLRVGLILAGPLPSLPFFAPAWIKAVRAALILPSDRMLYLVAGAQHKPGETWPSPYTDSIQQVALPSQAASQEGGSWREARYESPRPLDLVGLWLMADGDNTAASFKVRLKQLTLSE